MAISIVFPIQTGDSMGAGVTDGSTASSSPVTCTYIHAQTAGNTNLVCMSWVDATATFTSMSDSAGNTYQQVLSLSSPAHSMSMYVFVCVGIKAAAANTNTVTINVNTNGAFNFPELFIIELSGVTALDLSACTINSASSGTTATAGPVTCSYQHELLIGYMYTNTTENGLGTGWSFVMWSNGQQGTGNGGAMEQQSTSTGGSFTANTKLTPSGDWAQMIVGFTSDTPHTTKVQFTDTIFYGMT
jgi:hypothetical protein